MQEVIAKFEAKYKKTAIAQVSSGDTVRVYQKVREAGKERVQMFEGMVIKTSRLGSLTASVTVRRIASGVGVEKTYQLHSPQVTKVQIIRRSKVRRNFLSYMRARSGKSARLTEQEFDQAKVNVKEEVAKPAKEASQPKADVKAEKSVAEPETKSAEPVKDDKAAAKKAKAEAFRQAQLDKTKK